MPIYFGEAMTERERWESGHLGWCYLCLVVESKIRCTCGDDVISFGSRLDDRPILMLSADAYDDWARLAPPRPFEAGFRVIREGRIAVCDWGRR